MTTTTRVRPIRTEEDFQAALVRMEEIFDPEPGTPEDDEGEVLAILIQTYEREHDSWPTSDDPVAYLENRGLAPEFLVPHLGSELIVSEVMARKRPLTVEMIRNLHRNLGMPAENLIGT